MPQFLLAGSLPRYVGFQMEERGWGLDRAEEMIPEKPLPCFFRRSDRAAVEHRGKIEGKRREKHISYVLKQASRPELCRAALKVGEESVVTILSGH